MARIKSIRKDLQLATAHMDPAAIAGELAQFARDSLAEAIREGEASPRFERYVNGRLGAPESSVVPPGPVLYEFQWWREIVEFGLQALMERSPVRSGLYKKSWFAMVGASVVSDLDTIPVDEKVILTNNQPYSRKINVGHMKMSVPPGVVEDVKRTIMSRYGNMIECKATMITLPGGYILKGVFRKGIRPNARTKLRKDTMAGAQMTYPSLVLSMRD